jgi:hypothetical protein
VKFCKFGPACCTLPVVRNPILGSGALRVCMKELLTAIF